MAGGAERIGRNKKAGLYGGKRRSPAYSGPRKKRAGSEKGNFPVARLIPNAKGDVVVVRANQL